MTIYPGIYEVGVNFPVGCWLLRRISGVGELGINSTVPDRKSLFDCEATFDMTDEDVAPEAFSLGAVENGNFIMIEGTLTFELEDASL